MKIKTLSYEWEIQSMYDGLNELEKEFLRKEIQKDFRRPAKTLRRIAKKKAWSQQVKWKLEEIGTIVGIFSFVALIVLSFLIWNYR